MILEQLVADQPVFEKAGQALGPQAFAPGAQLGFGVHALDQLVEGHVKPRIAELG